MWFYITFKDKSVEAGFIRQNDNVDNTAGLGEEIGRVKNMPPFFISVDTVIDSLEKDGCNNEIIIILTEIRDTFYRLYYTYGNKLLTHNVRVKNGQTTEFDYKKDKGVLLIELMDDLDMTLILFVRILDLIEESVVKFENIYNKPVFEQTIDEHRITYQQLADEIYEKFKHGTYNNIKKYNPSLVNSNIIFKNVCDKYGFTRNWSILEQIKPIRNKIHTIQTYIGFAANIGIYLPITVLGNELHFHYEELKYTGEITEDKLNEFYSKCSNLEVFYNFIVDLQEFYTKLLKQYFTVHYF